MSSEKPTTWFVRMDGTEYGPFSDMELKKWAKQGNVGPDAEVRKGNGPWVSATKVKGLLPLQPPTLTPPSEPEKSLADIVAATKNKQANPSQTGSPPSIKLKRRRNNQALYLGIVGVVVFGLLGSGFLYWYNLPQNRERRAAAKIAEGFRELAEANRNNAKAVSGSVERMARPEPRPLTILAAEFTDDYYLSEIGSRVIYAFNIKVTVRNDSRDETLVRASYVTRTVKVGRNVREYQTLNENVPIRGGINPGEVIEHEYLVPCEDVGVSQARMYKLPEGTVLQVSIDGENWVEATHIEKERKLPEVPKDGANLLFNGM